jgi:hypothetical protein
MILGSSHRVSGAICLIRRLGLYLWVFCYYTLFTVVKTGGQVQPHAYSSSYSAERVCGDRGSSQQEQKVPKTPSQPMKRWE